MNNNHQADTRRLRTLVVIASYGEKNLPFLRKIIQQYRGMAMDVDLIVTSEGPKNLEAGVKVLVGLPSRNPHSLPFAHKRVFADHADQYDLFIYSEDDIDVRESSIQAFLRVTQNLSQDEIAGFIRYEVDQAGKMSVPDVHGAFHWRPDSVAKRGPYTIAEFTNEHSGFYILTQQQLRRAIDSGGFLRAPCEGRYGMLETGATDPYTSCGFRKVTCVSHLDDFLVHHMPNRYIGQMGIPLSSFQEQIQTLFEIFRGGHPPAVLCKVEPAGLPGRWNKSYYERPFKEVLDMVPETAHTVLSIGCGWGATESELKRRGCDVTALALDSVIAVEARHRGIEVLYGQLPEAFGQLRGRTFDCVLMTNLLHLLPNPSAVLRECAGLCPGGGSLVLAGYNFDYLPDLASRWLAVGEYGKLRNLDQSGVNAHSIREVRKQIDQAGLGVSSVRWFDQMQPTRFRSFRRRPGRFTSKNWVLRAEKAGDQSRSRPLSA